MKIPQLQKKPELKSCHNRTWEDNYSWIHQSNILEVLRDSSKLFPDVREYDTLAGFILDILTDIPQPGEQVEYNNMVFTVQTVENNRIEKVRIEKGNEPEEQSTNSR